MSEGDDERRDGSADDLLRAAPGMARLAGEAWWRTAEWTVDAAGRVLRAALSRPPPVEPSGEGEADADPPEPAAREEDSSAAALRARGEELLRRSADVDFEEDTHPAYARILSQLAPDEARILRLLAAQGPQPSVDVRTARPLRI